MLSSKGLLLYEEANIPMDYPALNIAADYRAGVTIGVSSGGHGTQLAAKDILLARLIDRDT